MAAAAGQDDLGLDLHFGHGVGQKDGIGGVGHEHDDVGLGGLELGHDRGEVGGGAGIGFVQDDLIAVFFGQLTPLLGKAGAPVAVFEDKGDPLQLDAGFFLHVLEETELVAHPPGVLGGDAEDVFEAALGDGVAYGHGHHEGDAVAFGHLGGRVGDGGVPATGHEVDFFGVDQALGLGDADGGVGLAVGVDELQLGPAQGLDAAGGVDFFNGHFPGLLALDADRSRRAGQGLDVADLDGLVGGQGRSGEQGGGQGHAHAAGQNRRDGTVFHACTFFIRCRLAGSGLVAVICRGFWRPRGCLLP